MLLQLQLQQLLVILLLLDLLLQLDLAHLLVPALPLRGNKQLNINKG
jgi:hypothetical protein